MSAAFISVAFSAARFGGLPGMFGGHLLIAVLVFVLDFRWISAAMAAPGWDGTPDMDFLFLPGVIIRVLLTNTLLLVVTIPVLLRRRQRTVAV